MKNKKPIIIAICAVVLVAIIVTVILVVNGKKGHRSVKVDEVTGTVNIIRGDGNSFDANSGMKLITEDKVEVADASSLLLLVDDDKHVAAEEGTKFIIEAAGSKKKGNVEIVLLEGKALFTIDEKLPEGSTFSVTTSNATMSVRGTKFEVSYDPVKKLTTLEVFDGTVHVDYEGEIESEDIDPGQNRVITDDAAYTGATLTEALEAVIGAVGGGGSGAMGAESDGIVIPADRAFAGFSALINDMVNYVTACPDLNEDYHAYDYMYFDYDQDGEKEIILYLRYNNDEGVYCRDTVFMDYYDSEGVVAIRAIVRGEADDRHFYATYNGDTQLARYSWTTNPMEAYLYLVMVNDKGELIYVLENAYDYIISDPMDAGLKPLPLHGSWEMLLED